MASPQYYVYILSDRYHRLLYIGVTIHLERRMFAHKHRLVEGFTKQYNLRYLLYFEQWDSLDKAMSRENQLKKWHRAWKLNLIRSTNPDYSDLSVTL